MNSPEFLQQMSSLMSNPAVLDQALALNPQYASMGPQAREIFQSERFRQMMLAPPFHLEFSCHTKSSCRSNPDSLRGMIQMASMMRNAGFDPLTGPFGGSTAVAPGNPNAPPASNTTSTTASPGGPAPGGTPPAPNVFGADPSALLQLLGGVPPSGTSPSADPSALLQLLGGVPPSGTPPSADPSALLQLLGGVPPSGTSPSADPSALLQLLGGVPPSGTPPSAGARPPEERFQVQLQVRYSVVRYAFGFIYSLL
jgi:ubiquilin